MINLIKIRNKREQWKKYFLQRICETTIVNSIMLMYPDGIIFTFINWNMDDTIGYIFGAIKAPIII